MKPHRVGFVVFGHGSSVESANEAVRIVADNAAREGEWQLYTTAFLEAEPLLAAGVEKLVAAGAVEIMILPYFLTLGIHLQRDLPLLMAQLSARFGIPVQTAPPLDGHPELSRILVDRAKQALS